MISIMVLTPIKFIPRTWGMPCIGARTFAWVQTSQLLISSFFRSEMSCHKRNKSDCSSWQGKFYNCRWDDLVGCVNETTKASPRTADDLKKPALESAADKKAQMENNTNSKPENCKIPACRTKTDAFKVVLGGNKKIKIAGEVALSARVGRTWTGNVGTIAHHGRQFT